MPHKGFFTQSAFVLLNAPVAIEKVAASLAKFPILKTGKATKTGWIGGGDFILINMRQEVNGRLLVDVVNQPWPDSMGDPKNEPELFAAWGMGHFGKWHCRRISIIDKQLCTGQLHAQQMA